MGATDNAFIKAYQDAKVSVATGLVERQLRAGVRVSEDGITVDPSLSTDESDQLLSQIVAGSNLSRPQEVDIAQRQKIHHEAHSVEDRIPRPHFDLSAFENATAAKTGLRTVQHAAVREALINQFGGKPSEVTSVRGTGTFRSTDPTDRVWSPEWEVDHFRWPEVCDQLHQQCVDRITNVLRPLLQAAWRGRNVVGVTSFSRNEGATTAALCMARTAASINVPTVLIDGDVNQRSIGERLGISFEQGWNDNSIPFVEAAVGSTEDQLTVVPATEGAADISRTLSLIHELADHFELVIVDTGPIFTAAHHWFEQPISSSMHNVIVVQDIRNTAPDELEDVHSRLSKSGMLDVAVVENFSASI